MNKKVFIGKHLRKMMETRNMTQAELAQKTGLFQQLISRYCNDITVPTATALILMALALDCSVDFLITGKEYKSAQPEQPQWISVDDRLPDKQPDEYLVVNAHIVETAICLDNRWITPRRVTKITHWMPLPEPPEVEQDGET